MKIATWNVNSILARLPNVVRWLEAEHPDVLCMQETKVVDEKFPFDVFAAHGYKCITLGQQSYNGVAIATRGECPVTHRGYPDSQEPDHARLITTSFGEIRILNVYVPNGQMVGADKYCFKLEWLARLRQFLDSNFDPKGAVLLCGDFNVAPEERDVHDPRLWQGRILFSDAERDAIQRVKDWGFVDAFRRHTEEGGHYSWWDYRAGAFRRNLGLRIDHIWVTELLAARNLETWIDVAPRSWERPSDHAPVIATFE